MSEANGLDSQVAPPEAAPEVQACRAWVRYACPGKSGRFSVVMETGTLDAVPVNISRDGVGLLVGQLLNPGTVVFVRLPKGGGEVLEMPGAVANTTATDAHSWLVGCRFARWLTETELQAVRSGAEAP